MALNEGLPKGKVWVEALQSASRKMPVQRPERSESPQDVVRALARKSEVGGGGTPHNI